MEGGITTLILGFTINMKVMYTSWNSLQGSFFSFGNFVWYPIRTEPIRGAVGHIQQYIVLLPHMLNTLTKFVSLVHLEKIDHRKLQTA